MMIETICLILLSCANQKQFSAIFWKCSVNWYLKSKSLNSKIAAGCNCYKAKASTTFRNWDRILLVTLQKVLPKWQLPKIEKYWLPVKFGSKSLLNCDRVARGSFIDCKLHIINLSLKVLALRHSVKCDRVWGRRVQPTPSKFIWTLYELCPLHSNTFGVRYEFDKIPQWFEKHAESL